MRKTMADTATIANKPLSRLRRLSLGTRKSFKKTNKDLRPLYKNVWAMLAIAFVVLAAQLTLLWRPIVGVYVNAAALALLVGLALWKDKLQQLAISAAIIPLSTMISLSLPQTSMFARTVVFYDAILVLGLIYRFIFTLDYPLGFTKLNL